MYLKKIMFLLISAININIVRKIYNIARNNLQCSTDTTIYGIANYPHLNQFNLAVMRDTFISPRVVEVNGR